MFCKVACVIVFSYFLSCPFASEPSLRSFQTLEEVYEQLQKDLIGHRGSVDIVSKLWMVGSPVKSHSNCYMMRHPKTKGLSEVDVRALYYLFDHLRGIDSNVVSLGGLTYTKTTEFDLDRTNGNRIHIKVERSEL